MNGTAFICWLGLLITAHGSFAASVRLWQTNLVIPTYLAAPPSPKRGSEEGTVMLVTTDAATLRVGLVAASDGRVLMEFKADTPAAGKP